MPFNPTQLAQGANATLETYRRNDPIDQVNTAHEVLKWLLKNKKPSTFGNGFYNETVYFTNASNHQNYFGADQVTYNEREQTRFAKFAYYNHQDGFWFDEDRLAANNIILTDDGDAQISDSEMQQLVNLLETSYYGLKEGINEGMADEFLLDGSTNPKAVPGLDHLISTNPTVGIVGGINAANAAYWRNNTNLDLATGQALIDGMEKTWRDCTRFGGMVPDYIPCGSSFLDAYRTAAAQTNQPSDQRRRQRQGWCDPGCQRVGHVLQGHPAGLGPDLRRPGRQARCDRQPVGEALLLPQQQDHQAAPPQGPVDGHPSPGEPGECIRLL